MGIFKSTPLTSELFAKILTMHVLPVRMTSIHAIRMFYVHCEVVAFRQHPLLQRAKYVGVPVLRGVTHIY